MISRFIYLLVFIFCLLTCSKSPENVNEMIIDDPEEVATIKDVVKLRDTRKNDDAISVKNEFKNIEYIRFDNRKVIGTIIDIAFTKEFIFVILSHGGGVMKYNRQGKFVKLIAREGEGPTQVFTPHHLFVDELRERVYVMQYNKKKRVSIFSFDGKFLGGMEHPFDKTYFVHHLGDEVFFASYASGLLSDSLNYGTGIFDNFGNTYYTRKSYLKNFVPENTYYKYIHFFRQNKSLLFYINGTNILYRAERDTIIPSYYLEFKNSISDDIFQLSHRPQLYTNFTTENRREYLWLYEDPFWETDSCLYLKTSGYIWQYNRNDKTTKCFSTSKKKYYGIPNDIDNGAPIWPTHYYPKEDIFVQTLSGFEIQLLKDRGLLCENVPAIYQEMGEDSNPLIVVYKCD